MTKEQKAENYRKIITTIGHPGAVRTLGRDKQIKPKFGYIIGSLNPKPYLFWRYDHSSFCTIFFNVSCSEGSLLKVNESTFTFPSPESSYLTKNNKYVGQYGSWMMPLYAKNSTSTELVHQTQKKINSTGIKHTQVRWIENRTFPSGLVLSHWLKRWCLWSPSCIFI